MKYVLHNPMVGKVTDRWGTAPLPIAPKKKGRKENRKPRTSYWLKKVVEIDDHGRVVREWPSMKDCARSIGVPPASLRRSLNRKDERYCGHILRYADEGGLEI